MFASLKRAGSFVWTSVCNVVKGVVYTISGMLMLLAIITLITASVFYHNPTGVENVYTFFTGLSREVRALLYILTGFVGMAGITGIGYMLVTNANMRRIAAFIGKGSTRIVGATSAAILVTLASLALGQMVMPNVTGRISNAASKRVAQAVYAFDAKTEYLTHKLDLPKIDESAIRNQKIALPTVVYDADGNEMGCFAKEYRVFIPLTDVLKTSAAVRAIMASEDAGFYTHGGFDTLAMTRAALANIAGGRIQSGASTLTMQLIKNFYLSPERSYKRKLRELILATHVEHMATKDQILELYVNFIYLGGGYGIEAAARSYFGKTAETLSYAEAAFIAGLINYPNVVQTQGARGLARALARKDRVLRLMYERNMLTKAALEEALREKLEPKKFVRACEKRVPFILHEVNKQIGIEGKTKIAEAGLTVHTTISPKHQTALEEGCVQSLAAYTARHRENKDSIRCSALSIEVATGHVVALVPGQDYARDQWSGVTQSQRQAGSVFKPILYAALLKKRLHDELAKRATFCRETDDHAACVAQWTEPVDLVDDCAVNDAPTPVPNVVGWKGRIVSRHWVKNYPYEDRPRHRGKISCRLALAESRNAAAMWALGQLSDESGELARWNESEQELVTMAQNLGITSELRHLNVTGKTEEERAKYIPNYTLAIGSAEVTLWELARAFLPLVNGGYAQPISLFKSITDRHGPKFESDNEKASPDRVLDPEVAIAVRTLLEAVVDEDLGTAHSLRREHNFPEGALCGKTGTATNADASSTDNWFVGCTKTHLVVVRLNNKDKVPLGKKETGGKNALPVFLAYAKAMDLVHPDDTFADIEIPQRPLPTVLETEVGATQK